MNPYINAIKIILKDQGLGEDPLSIRDFYSSYLLRHELIGRYSWAILDDEAIDIISQFGPILSVGAGNGYNEWLLQQTGAEVIATDLEPGNFTNRGRPRTEHVWADVLLLDALEAVKLHGKGRSLMFCWPSYAEEWPTEALRAYSGDTVIYIGEDGGCTANDSFDLLLSKEWGLHVQQRIPQWAGLNDDLKIYKRK